MSDNRIIQAVVWPAPANVHAVFTTRNGGVSEGPFASLNLGAQVHDKPSAVTENRKRLAHAISAKPRFLKQVHDTNVANLDDGLLRGEVVADAAVVSKPGITCLVMVADCLPVLISNVQGTVVAAAHCGWRGLSGVNHNGIGVLEKTILAARAKAAMIRSRADGRPQWVDSSASMSRPSDEWIAWLGPAIGPRHFEVGPEVREAFVYYNPEDARAFSASKNKDKFMANLFALARLRLARLGVTQIMGGGDCTYSQPEKYFSHRRATHESGATGRQAAMIWIEAA